ncbi:MAG: MazG-like family protein [Lachnospiraceae bacterium]|nr:MazG-like family protein [Lachnospiraceae bacterium]
MIDLNDLAYKMRNVAYVRKTNGANVDTDTMAMLKHCASEVVEATEAYNTLDSAINDNCEYERNIIELQEHLESELADVIACILIICANEPTIDIEEALQKCFQKNLARAEGRGDKK